MEIETRVTSIGIFPLEQKTREGVCSKMHDWWKILRSPTRMQPRFDESQMCTRGVGSIAVFVLWCFCIDAKNIFLIIFLVVGSLVLFFKESVFGERFFSRRKTIYFRLLYYYWHLNAVTERLNSNKSNKTYD